MSAAADWADVAVAVAAHSIAYDAMLTARQENREGSKKTKAAEEAWYAAHFDRLEALKAHWDQELDGHNSAGSPSYGSTLRRYYQETYVPNTKKVKR